MPRSNHAATGLYFYDAEVVENAKLRKPSPRGGARVTDINRKYFELGALTVRRKKRQDVKIGCPEEVDKSGYGRYPLSSLDLS